jgi:formylglycine-generating enzyme required for sulfatase activity
MTTQNMKARSVRSNTRSPLALASMAALLLVSGCGPSSEKPATGSKESAKAETKKSGPPSDYRVELSLPAGAKPLELVFLSPDTRTGLAPFFMGKYLVTQAQYESAMSNNPSVYKSGPDYPVEHLLWKAAKAFCDKINQTCKLPEGYHLTLPTDAQWSFAVGLENEAGATPEEKDGKVEGVYPWGTEWPPPNGAANLFDMSRKIQQHLAIKGYNDGYSDTSPVGTFRPNKFGLYDMAGNVRQFCEDPYGKEDDSPVARGSSYDTKDSDYLWSSHRSHLTQDWRDSGVGFRVVLAAATSP